ncbi:MAG: hypothetical protein ACTSUF_03465 [Candidatus Heimdallarchaeaceae archaeon]
MPCEELFEHIDNISADASKLGLPIEAKSFGETCFLGSYGKEKKLKVFKKILKSRFEDVRVRIR